VVEVVEREEEQADIIHTRNLVLGWLQMAMATEVEELVEMETGMGMVEEEAQCLGTARVDIPIQQYLNLHRLVRPILQTCTPISQYQIAQNWIHGSVWAAKLVERITLRYVLHSHSLILRRGVQLTR
jgi:hypothetical protein